MPHFKKDQNDLMCSLMKNKTIKNDLVYYITLSNDLRIRQSDTVQMLETNSAEKYLTKHSPQLI